MSSYIFDKINNDNAPDNKIMHPELLAAAVNIRLVIVRSNIE
jgi:hypothetical protein